jgi:hypothetical protein
MGDLTNTPVRLELDQLGKLADLMIYRLPGCSDLMVRKELQRVSREFTRATGGFREILTITPEENTYTYDLLPSFDATIEMVSTVTMFDVVVADNLYDVTDGDPVRITFHEDWFDNAYAAADTADMTGSVVVMLVPEIGCESFPDHFLKRNGEAIVAGALMNLARIPNMPWTNPSMAVSEGIIYQNFLNDATIRRINGMIQRDMNNRSSVSWLQGR